jgi:hypothetical protein
MAHLNECYPGAFGKIERTASDSPEELVVRGPVTQPREGIRFAPAMVSRLGSTEFAWFESESMGRHRSVRRDATPGRCLEPFPRRSILLFVAPTVPSGVAGNGDLAPRTIIEARQSARYVESCPEHLASLQFDWVLGLARSVSSVPAT